MRLIRSKDTKIEIKFRKILRKLGYRFRNNPGSYFGKPDIVLKKLNTVIFIDSCFWHGCKKHLKLPLTRKAFWTTKIQRNKRRDREVTRHYRKDGWKVMRIWEHDLKNKDFVFNASQMNKSVASRARKTKCKIKKND